jgi:hypothetical protein
MMACSGCEQELEAAFRFCPWCGTPQRLKLVEFFRSHPLIGRNDGALRASRYFGPEPEDRHVRFSIWRNEAAEAAVSLPEEEAERLTRFLAVPTRISGPPLRRVDGDRYVLEQDVALAAEPAEGTGPVEDVGRSIEFLRTFDRGGVSTAAAAEGR